MNIIDAQNTLTQLRVVSYPKMRKPDRSAFYKELHVTAFPRKKSDKELSTEDLANHLSRFING